MRLQVIKALSEVLKANPYGSAAALKTTLEQVKWYSDALVAARATV